MVILCFLKQVFGFLKNIKLFLAESIQQNYFRDLFEELINEKGENGSLSCASY